MATSGDWNRVGAARLPGHHQQGPGEDQDVTDAGHVVQREPRRGGEDVAEELHSRVDDGRRVGEPGRDGEVRKGQGSVGGRHHPPVGGDGGGVGRRSEGDEPQPRDVAVGPEDRANGTVGRQVDDQVGATPSGRPHRDDGCLGDEGDHGEGPPTQADLIEPAEVGAAEAEQDQAGDERGDEQHAQRSESERRAVAASECRK
jgi:hypothetical protein